MLDRTIRLTVACLGLLTLVACWQQAGSAGLPDGARVVGGREAESVVGSQIQCKRSEYAPGGFCKAECGFTGGIPEPGNDDSDDKYYHYFTQKCAMNPNCKKDRVDKNEICSPP